MSPPFFKKSRSRKQDERWKKLQAEHAKPYEGFTLSRSLQTNMDNLQSELGYSSDLIIRKFRVGKKGEVEAAIFFTDGLTDQKGVSDMIMRTLMLENESIPLGSASEQENAWHVFKARALTVAGVTETTEWKQVMASVLTGETIIMFDGNDRALIASTRDWHVRAVEEPPSQKVIRGPREGFTESIRINTSLIRRKIRSPRLWIQQITIGEVTQTDVCMMYIKGIAKDSNVKEVWERLGRIKLDGILESGYLEEFIEDEIWTPFPTVYHTERPDAVAAGLLEGRIAILVDGTPFVLIVPTVFNSFFQSPEDYYQRYDIGTFIRMLRFTAFFIALLLPAIYVAIISYHQEMIPTPLMLNLAAMREGVPFPPIVEAFMMEITLEILREAGVRLPSAIGNTISIFGALVIGQAAVEAGLVSPAMVIVVSLTAISSFVSPAFNMAIAARLMRFVILLLAGTFGMYGIAIALIFLTLHLASLRSLGVPYLKPFSPLLPDGHKDAVLRFPLWAHSKRPGMISQDPIREETNALPHKPQKR